MKSLMLAMLILFGSATQAKTIVVNDGPEEDAKTAMFFSCKAMAQAIQATPACNAIIQKSRAGYLVSRRNYNNWCETKAHFVKEANHWAADYKKAAHKAINYKNCPAESTAI